MSDIAQDLRQAAAEIRQEGHAGWGNTCAWGADEIERLTVSLKRANETSEHFERHWYLRGDEIERLTADRSRLLNAARRAVTALAAAAERTPEFQRDYEMLAGSLAPFRGEWPKEQR